MSKDAIVLRTLGMSLMARGTIREENSLAAYKGSVFLNSVVVDGERLVRIVCVGVVGERSGLFVDSNI